MWWEPCLVVLLAGSVTSKRPDAAFGPCASEAEHDDTPRCEVRAKGQAVSCSGGLRERIWGSKIRDLTLCRWPYDAFDPERFLSLFPGLKKLTLVNSNVSVLTSDFPRSSRQLEFLNMSGLLLEMVTDTMFAEMTVLRVLDLRHNHLREMEEVTVGSPPLLEVVYLSGNKWACSTDLTWLVDNSTNSSVARRIVDRDKMNCSGSPFAGKPIVPVMTYIKTLRDECPVGPPNNCSCEMSNIVRGLGGYLIPVITVDCNQRGLTELPATLPTNTSTLYVKGNKISSLKPLVNNPHYISVVDIFLDDNNVESVAELEGADWLSNFRVLSLRGNHLKEFPTYALDNALQRNNRAINIYLGDNPWRCDCIFTPDFQELLVKYLILVKDIYAIKCSFVEDDENSLMEIRDLSRSAICREPSEYLIKPLDLLNGILAFLIVLVIGKLCYDYWSFKRTGKLPWLVAKMP